MRPPPGDLLARRAARSPGATALVDAAGGDSWTYAELDAAADRTARRLGGLGVGAGDHLGLLSGTRPAVARLLFAAARVGATLVPLNARLATPELERAGRRADLDALVCGADTEPAAVAVGEAAGVPVASVDAPAAGARAFDDARDVEHAGLRPGATQLLVFTSGTTGSPKAVRLTPTNLRASAVGSALRLGLDPSDRWYSPLATYHVGGLAPLLRSTLYGTTTVLAREFDAATALGHLRRHGCTAVSLVPTMLRRLLDAADTDAAAVPDSVRFVLLGGAPAPPGLVERCGDAGVPVCPTYGLTEAASQVTTARRGEALAHPGTVGRPLFETEVTVVGEDGDPVPPGEAGEVVVDGPAVTPGYYGDDAPDPFGEHGLHTGDVGYLEDGRLWVVGRLDDRVVTGGENVDPGEVTAALRSHPGVADAAVVGVSDPEWGERVAALVVPSGDPPDPDALREHCRERLAGYKLPRTVAFADALPRTASGTVDRAAVRERLARAD